MAKIIIFSFSGNFGRLKIKFGDRPLNFGGSLQIDLTVGNRNHPMVISNAENVVIYQGELTLSGKWSNNQAEKRWSGHYYQTEMGQKRVQRLHYHPGKGT